MYQKDLLFNTHVLTGYLSHVIIYMYSMMDTSLLKKEVNMKNFAFSFNQKNKRTRPATEIFQDTLQLVMHNDILCIEFNLVEDRKGYGAQFVPVDELEQVSAILVNARDNGIANETEQLSTAQILRKSLVETEKGEIRFKTEDTKGKKPTVCKDQSDFNEFVDTFMSVLPAMQSEIQRVQRELSKMNDTDSNTEE